MKYVVLVLCAAVVGGAAMLAVNYAVPLVKKTIPGAG